MPQSLSNVLIHIVFSTKNRAPLLEREFRSEVHRYIAATLNNHCSQALEIGGVEDHVHILVRMPRTMTIAQVVEKAKTSSSKWLKEKNAAFSWQGGYGASSVSPDHSEHVVSYIQNQEAHHRQVSFQDEFRQLLLEARIEWDERYVWD